LAAWPEVLTPGSLVAPGLELDFLAVVAPVVVEVAPAVPFVVDEGAEEAPLEVPLPEPVVGEPVELEPEAPDPVVEEPVPVVEDLEVEEDEAEEVEVVLPAEPALYVMVRFAAPLPSSRYVRRSFEAETVAPAGKPVCDWMVCPGGAKSTWSMGAGFADGLRSVRVCVVPERPA
jgi:hypothetical protein